MSRRRGLGAALLMLLCLPAFRGWAESRMSLHMALELPALLLAGALLTPGRCSALQSLDVGGLFSATAASCVLAAWMVPAALDLAVLEPGVALLKYGMWTGAGLLLRLASTRITPVVAAFFLGNAGWMTATAGLLYLDAEQQLCVNYLVNDQQLTGMALIAWGAALGTITVWVLRPLLVERA